MNRAVFTNCKIQIDRFPVGKKSLKIHEQDYLGNAICVIVVQTSTVIIYFITKKYIIAMCYPQYLLGNRWSSKRNERVNPTFASASIPRRQKSSAFPPVTANQNPYNLCHKRLPSQHHNVALIFPTHPAQCNDHKCLSLSQNSVFSFVFLLDLYLCE